MALATGGAGAQAADYPTKPITLIIPFAAGSPTDTVGRLIGRAMEGDLKQPVLVENAGVPGARWAPDA